MTNLFYGISQLRSILGKYQLFEMDTLIEFCTFRDQNFPDFRSDIEENRGNATSEFFTPTKFRKNFSFEKRIIVHSFAMYNVFSGIHIMNLREESIQYPEDDPTWQVPYNNADIASLIAGMNHYFSVAIRNQLAREQSGNVLQSNLPLYQVDLDYAKGCILSQRLLEVFTLCLFSRSSPFNCAIFFLLGE